MSELDTASALGRAFSAARELRDYAVGVRQATDDTPFTMPVVRLSSDDDAAECYVSTSWGYSSELEVLAGVARKYHGDLGIHRVTGGQADDQIRATLRFVKLT